MELVYLWVEEYKNIKRQGFNFSPRFRCEFKAEYKKDKDGNEVLEDDCELIIEKNEDYVSIFPENINVTAIVGENGSGKSSVFEIFSNILRLNNNEQFNYFYVLNDGSSNICYSNNIKLLEKDIAVEKNIPIRVIDGSLDKSIRNYKVALEEHFDINYLNISHLERDGIIKNDSESPKDPIKYYGIYKKNDIKNNYHRTNFYQTFSNFQLSQFNFLQTYAISYLLRDDKYKKLFFKEFKITQPNCINVKYIKKDLENIKVSNTPNGDETRVIDSTIPNIIDEILTIVENDNLIIGTEQFNNFFKLVSSKNLEDKFELTFQTNEGKSISLSSGEKTILFYLQKIDLMISRFSNKDNLLLFDEVELYLHPNWQKRILKIILNFIKENQLAKNLHVIVFSHSPFILSDIPKENVIFLEKDKETGNCINATEKMKDFNTFGANIHTLLSHGFFMKDGLMGEFAKSKIERIKRFYDFTTKYKDKIFSKEKVHLRIEKYYKLNKKEFDYIASIIGEQFLQKVMKNYLDELEEIFDKENYKQKKLKKLVEEFGEDALRKFLEND